MGDGAGEGNRTLVFSLEGCCSTIELHPRRHHVIQWLQKVQSFSQRIVMLIDDARASLRSKLYQ